MASKHKLSVETYRSHAAEEVLRTALEELGWRNVSSSSSVASKNSCDIYWRGLSSTDGLPLTNSYVASIPGMGGAAHKDQLSRHIKRLSTLYPEEFAFYPQTWLLPEEQEQFDEYATQRKARGRRATYIVKPDEGSQGEGIFLVQNPRDLYCLRVPSIVQEYVSNPYLIRGLKFDLRLYVLVTGIDPPEVFLCQSGMARFCTVRYEAPTVRNLHQTLMHLTNYSLNKRSRDFVHTEDGEGGTKQTLEAMLREIEGAGYSREEVWGEIEELVCKKVVALLPQLMVEQQSHMAECCLREPPRGFQLLGVDILLDNKLHPHLLEINAHPSLRVDFEQPKSPGVVEYVPSPVDMAIKLPVVKDTLRIIGSKVKQLDTAQVVRESCFTELLPRRLDSFSHLRVFERCAMLFNKYVGTRGGVKMGSTAFRTFVRSCNLIGPKFTTADVDILHIEMCRNHGNTYSHERSALSFHGFCTTLTALARRLYGTATPTSLDQLLTHCHV